MAESVGALKEQLDGRVEITEEAAKSTAAMLHPPSKTDNPGFPDANNTASIRSNCDVNYTINPPSILSSTSEPEGGSKWNCSVYQNPNNLESPIGIWCWADGYEDTFGQLTYPTAYDWDNAIQKHYATQSYPLWGKDMYCVKQDQANIGPHTNSAANVPTTNTFSVAQTTGSSMEGIMSSVTETQQVSHTYTGDVGYGVDPYFPSEVDAPKVALASAKKDKLGSGEPPAGTSALYQQGYKGFVWYDKMYFDGQNDTIKGRVVAYIKYISDPFIPSYGSAAQWRCIAASNTVYMECAELYKQGMVYGGQAAPPTRGRRQYSYNNSARGYPEEIRDGFDPLVLSTEGSKTIHIKDLKCYRPDFVKCEPTYAVAKVAGEKHTTVHLTYKEDSTVTFRSFGVYDDGEFCIKGQDVYNVKLISYDIAEDSVNNAKTSRSITDSFGKIIPAGTHLNVKQVDGAHATFSVCPDLVGRSFTHSGGTVTITEQDGEVLTFDSAALGNLSIVVLASRLNSGDYANWNGIPLNTYLTEREEVRLHYQNFNDYITHGDLEATVLMVSTDEFSVPSMELYRGVIGGLCTVKGIDFVQHTLQPVLAPKENDISKLIFVDERISGTLDGTLYRPFLSTMLDSSTSFVPTDRNAIQTMSQMMQHEAKHGSFQVARLYDSHNPYVAALDFSNTGTAVSNIYTEASTYTEWFYTRGSRADQAIVWNGSGGGMYAPYPFGYVSRKGSECAPTEYSKAMNDWQQVKTMGGCGLAHYNKAQTTTAWGCPVALYQGMLVQAVLKGRGSRDLEITPIVGSQLAALISEPARPDNIGIDAAVTYLNKTPVLMRARDNDVGSWLNTLTQIGKVAAPMLTALHPAAGMIASAAMAGLNHANNHFQRNANKDIQRVEDKVEHAIQQSQNAMRQFPSVVRQAAAATRGPFQPTVYNTKQGGPPGPTQNAFAQQQSKSQRRRAAKKQKKLLFGQLNASNAILNGSPGVANNPTAISWAQPNDNWGAAGAGWPNTDQPPLPKRAPRQRRRGANGPAAQQNGNNYSMTPLPPVPMPRTSNLAI